MVQKDLCKLYDILRQGKPQEVRGLPVPTVTPFRRSTWGFRSQKFDAAEGEEMHVHIQEEEVQVAKVFMGTS